MQTEGHMDGIPTSTDCNSQSSDHALIYGSRSYSLRRFALRYSLRVFLVAFSALAIWVGYETRLAGQRRELTRQVHGLGGYVEYASEAWYPILDEQLAFYPEPAPPERVPGFMSRILGREFHEEVHVVVLALTNTTDADLLAMPQLGSVRRLELDGTSVTDAGLMRLASCDRLEYLSLWNLKVGDAGIAQIKALRRLKYLNLHGTHLTDLGMEHLLGFADLEHVDLTETRVSPAGIQRLKEALPNAYIRYD
jgi:hypothetical protein